MGKVILGLALSLDGYSNDRHGSGLRPLDNLGPEPVKLDRLVVQDWPGGGTHLRFRIIK